MSAATSPRTRRNSCGCVCRSRRRDRLCCTSGCSMTVTPFTSVQVGGGEEIHPSGLKFWRLQPEIDFYALRVALAEHPEQVGEIVVQAILNQIEILDASDV